MLEGNLRKLGGEIAARGEAAGFVIIEEGVDLLRHFPHLARLEKRYIYIYIYMPQRAPTPGSQTPGSQTGSQAGPLLTRLSLALDRRWPQFHTTKWMQVLMSESRERKQAGR